MEIRKLRYFVTLAEELHFGRAAQRLALTQPPLSLAIQGLERELGVALFLRSRREVSLTHAGATFLVEARAILARAAQAVDLARAADRGEVGRLAVGFLAATAYTLLPPLLRDFTGSFPGVALDLRELTMHEQLEALRRGDIQIALLRAPLTDAGLSFEVILEEPMVLALPANHRLAKLRRVPAKRLANEPFVMFPRRPGTVFHDFITGFFQRTGCTPRIVQEATQTHAVIGLVSAGIGCALVAASARSMGLRGVAYRPLLEDAPVVRTALAWRSSDTSPVVAGFLATARRAARQL